MFRYQKNILSQMEPCTPDVWHQLITSPTYKDIIRQVRVINAQLKALSATNPDRKRLERDKSNLKKRLPGITFQADFIVSTSKKGYKGFWRKNAAAILNGLYMVDVDHVEHPKELWESVADQAIQRGVLLAFITASGEGLKLVAKADATVGNIAANQRNLCTALQLPLDEACKDAARLSFAPTNNDILYIQEDELFTYNDPRFDELYGPGYRDGSGLPMLSAEMDIKKTEKIEEKKETKDDEQLTFAGVSYQKIVSAYEKKNGVPPTGVRHTWLLRAARMLRYICDHKESRLVEVLKLSQAGAAIAAEGTRELDDIAAAACAYKSMSGLPKEVTAICEEVGAQLSSSATADEPASQATIDYDYWWSRLHDVLIDDEPLQDAIADLPDSVKLGGVLSSLAMFGTYLTKCWYRHYDGQDYRLSYIVYIIGDAASGKSFIIRQDKDIMHCMKGQDALGRANERRFKEEKERRSQSSKDAKSAAPNRPHDVVRYVPSTISNAKLYQRLTDAVTTVDGTELHLHLFTMESELATALRVQVGSWAGKLDLELKSFQNEYAGVDYANEQSVNGLIQVNWNQVISGTMDALDKKMRGGSITDGYITRMALWIMPRTDYRMIEKASLAKCETSRDEHGNDRHERLRLWGYKLDELSGNIPCEKLTDYAYEWCARQCDLAALEDDQLVDYFRKRIPIYMVRYALPRAIMRQYETFKKTGKLRITENDLAFARLIGDYLMFISIYQWGNALLDSFANTASKAKPRERTSLFQKKFEELPEVFTYEQIARGYNTENAVRSVISRLKAAGLIEKVEKNKWKKCVSTLNSVTQRKDES